MHRPHSITWTTHTEESTTLLEATRLQEALLYTALHYIYMCNIVTEFYLYSIVYIYLITGADPGFDWGGPDRDRPKTAILGPQFCRILVLGPHFW